MEDSIWIWQVTSSADTALPDVTGYEVEALDGHIGKVDEATYDNDRGALVVDTGFWIFGKKRLVPAGVVTGLDTEHEKVRVSLTKDEIKDAPDFRAEQHKTDEPGYHDEERAYYDRFGRSKGSSN